MATTGGPRGQQGLYRLKPASQRLVQPLADTFAARGVSPDVLSLIAILVAGIGGACLALSPSTPAALLGVPLAAAIRLVLNLLDGMVARRLAAGGPGRAIGELWNELGDRVADLLFIGGLAFVPAVGPWLGLSAATAAVLASYAGITARAAGGRRQYGGVMSKPGRMIVLAVAAPMAFLTGDERWLVGSAIVLLAGSLVTLLQRIRTASVELGGAPDAG
jgi:CDP-diacylglycerol--glycerol-3-phosphate 3-phosphatidyltransferase